ncbi:hypothetical protein [Arsukibacterium sp. UBA3155]
MSFYALFAHKIDDPES